MVCLSLSPIFGLANLPYMADLVYTHLSPILSAILIAWPSYYANDRLQRISYLNWNRLEQEKTESVEAKSRLDNQLTLMFPQAILPALRADFESVGSAKATAV
jgi:hypothetical protein